jgi:uncharacterized protein YceH (UPF0502 family)
MHPLESLAAVETELENLASRPEPLVRRIAPAPGSRAPRYTQLLCPSLHPLDAAPAPFPATAGSHTARSADAELEMRIGRLEAEVAAIREVIAQIPGAAFRAPPSDLPGTTGAD